jgi:hypothetical protein
MNWILASAQEAFKGARDRTGEFNAARGNRSLLDSLFVDRPNGRFSYQEPEFQPGVEAA